MLPGGATDAASPAAVVPPPSVAGAAIKVVTTTTVFADIVRNVAGDHATVVSIIPAGVGPEDYEPTPADAQLLADTDLVVSNGAGLDDFLRRLLGSGTGGQVTQLVLGDAIPVSEVDATGNPHFWLDPTLVAHDYIPAIVSALSTIDGPHADAYAANGASYISQLLSLDRDLMAIVATIPEGQRKLVTFHDAFPYLARHYGFQLVGVVLHNVGAEPATGDLARLVDSIKATGVRAVFSEAQFSPDLARILAEEAGISDIVTNLYTDALGDPPADTYLGMMRTDITRIAEALR